MFRITQNICFLLIIAQGIQFLVMLYILTITIVNIHVSIEQTTLIITATPTSGTGILSACYTGSQSKQAFSKLAKLVVLRRFDVCFFLNKVGSVWNLNQLHVTIFLQLFALQLNAVQ